MKYIKPEFDVTIYEVEDILTASEGTTAPDLGYGEGAEGGDTDWDDFGNF
jgi:hypothetical protein